MKNSIQKIVFRVFLLAAIFSSCSKDNDSPDTEYPVIDISVPGAFPVQCSELTRGETFTFKALFKDNKALGSYSLDIHHNFDHHSHSTEVSECQMDPIKTAVNPFLLIKTFPINGNLSQYDASAEITVPADVDAGDYHFLVRLTDVEGWQTIKGVSISIK
jgi:hypothetical protein